MEDTYYICIDAKPGSKKEAELFDYVRQHCMYYSVRRYGDVSEHTTFTMLCGRKQRDHILSRKMNVVFLDRNRPFGSLFDDE